MIIDFRVTDEHEESCIAARIAVESATPSSVDLERKACMPPKMY